jgi:hypothetical protein
MGKFPNKITIKTFFFIMLPILSATESIVSEVVTQQGNSRGAVI